MRDCNHMPGAHKDAKCPLCSDLQKHGKAVTKHAITILNNQERKADRRACPVCSEACDELVTRKGQLMCEPCAEGMDE